MRSPLLFLAFNRPAITRQVFDSVRKAKPQRLYLAVDGPRPDHQDDHERTREVRGICSAVDWPCTVKTLFRDKNLGCRQSVSSAITWFFEHEEEGIILEDDCVPSPDFFPFCDDMLAHYRDNPDIWCVTGDNFQQGILRGEASYYFSRYPHIWGWATWRRCWQYYDVNLSFWPEWGNTAGFTELFKNTAERRHWRYVFERVYAGEIDTWDLQWVATVWRQGGLTVTPQENLVTNIGFGPDATHTRRRDKKMAIPISAQNARTLQHPARVAANQEADDYVFWNVFYSDKVKLSWLSWLREELSNVQLLPRLAARKPA